jgi:hypothetical protein
MLRPADRAWISIGIGVVAYDLLAAPGQTLSEGADRYMLSHPWITRAVAAALAGHVCNVLRPEYDPIHLLFAGARAWREARWTSGRSHQRGAWTYQRAGGLRHRPSDS